MTERTEMSNKNSETKAFETVGKKQKGFKSNKSRQNLVIAIFAVIVLILACLSTLIIGKVVDRLGQTTTTTTPPPSNVTYIPKDAGDVKIGNLLYINSDYQYSYPDDMDIINLWEYKNNSANNDKTTITVGGNKFPTYELNGATHANQIALDSTALERFNAMILDYCLTLDLSSHEEGSASGLNVAWGWSDAETVIEDVDKYGETFYEHALGTVLTLFYNSKSLSESVLKSNFEWIYDNAHKYGFIIRFPDACAEHTGFSSTTRIHLRYIGVEHATYIHENGICLDEYLSELRTSHNGIDNPLTFTANGKTYDVYYVKYTGNRTLVPVPKDNDNYVVSGDNMNGFIITVEK